MASTFKPAGAPPPGVTPNFDNPQDTLYNAIVTTTSLIIAITTAFTAARLVARKSVASYAVDDCAIYTCLVSLGMSLLTLRQIS